jgi:tRNA(fMet)-specific endonuclease VapC
MSAQDLYLLDTNVVVELIRGNRRGKYIDEKFKLSRSIDTLHISVVTIGETLALARSLGWGKEKSEALKSILKQLIILDINNDEILNAYASIDHYSLRSGVRMGKNDVWIAATAHASETVLLTSDRDFDHLDGKWIDRIWNDPDDRAV